MTESVKVSNTSIYTYMPCPVISLTISQPGGSHLYLDLEIESAAQLKKQLVVALRNARRFDKARMSAYREMWKDRG
jgi:hypothetical protein